MWLLLSCGLCLFDAVRFGVNGANFSLPGHYKSTWPVRSTWFSEARGGIARTWVIGRYEADAGDPRVARSSTFRRAGLMVNDLPWSFTRRVRGVPANSMIQRGTYVNEDIFGWPVRWVGTRAIGTPVAIPGPVSLARGSIGTGTWFVWWPGLMANVLLAIFATLAFHTVREKWQMHRHATRLASDRCVRCGHSREGLTRGKPCPECGEGS